MTFDAFLQNDICLLFYQSIRGIVWFQNSQHVAHIPFLLAVSAPVLPLLHHRGHTAADACMRISGPGPARRSSTRAIVSVRSAADDASGVENTESKIDEYNEVMTESKSDEYSEVMQQRMGTSLTYR